MNDYTRCANLGLKIPIDHALITAFLLTFYLKKCTLE
jgi:hypothetical protein